MLMNLFSSFNPASSYFNLNWVTLIIPIISLPLSFFLKKTRLTSFLMSILKILKKELNPFMSSFLGANILLSLFLMISLINFMGLAPYIFTPTSHMSISFNLALPLWGMSIIFGLYFSANLMFTHLTPSNTPTPLIPLMIMIEIVSLLIRPLTLAIRLTANMITGHLLLILLNSLMSSLTPLLFMCVIPVDLILMILETAVAFIQAYIFLTLITLYTSEINYVP